MTHTGRLTPGGCRFPICKMGLQMGPVSAAGGRFETVRLPVCVRESRGWCPRCTSPRGAGGGGLGSGAGGWPTAHPAVPGVPTSPATLAPLSCVRDRDVSSSSMNAGSSRALLREGAGSLGASIPQPDLLARASPCSLVSLALVHAFAERGCSALTCGLSAADARAAASSSAPPPRCRQERSRLASSACARSANYRLKCRCRGAGAPPGPAEPPAGLLAGAVRASA